MSETQHTHPMAGSTRLLGPGLAIGAAVSFALSVPLGKWLLGDLGSFTLAGILYLGAGIALTMFRAIVGEDAKDADAQHDMIEAAPTRRSRLFLAGAVLCGGVTAPALLFWGLANLSAAPASLLLSLEVVFTALLAELIFREQVAKQVWVAVVLMVAASVLLSWSGGGSSWSLSAVAVGLATLFWGLDNNLTREVNGYSPAFIAQVKGLIAGSVNLIIGIVVTGEVPHLLPGLMAAALGAVSYGLSLVLFVRALRLLGSARTGAYFSSAPVFAGVLSLVIFLEKPGLRLLSAFVLVVLATVLMITERHAHEHTHGPVTHSHSHWPDQEHRHAH